VLSPGQRRLEQPGPLSLSLCGLAHGMRTYKRSMRRVIADARVAGPCLRDQSDSSRAIPARSNAMTVTIRTVAIPATRSAIVIICLPFLPGSPGVALGRLVALRARSRELRKADPAAA
jgi:hypothetical protein